MALRFKVVPHVALSFTNVVTCSERKYVNDGRVVTTVSIQKIPVKLWRQLSKQGILEKLRKERKGWTFYTVANN